MSYPYLSDLFRALLHIDVYAPIPMFGIFVAFAVLAATSVFRRAVLRAEDIGRLPGNAHLAVGDLAWVTLIAGILGARIFHVMDHLDVYQQDPAAMVFSRGGFFDFRWALFWANCRDLSSAAARSSSRADARCRSSSVDVGIRDRPDWLPGFGRWRLGHHSQSGAKARVASDMATGTDLRRKYSGRHDCATWRLSHSSL